MELIRGKDSRGDVIILGPNEELDAETLDRLVGEVKHEASEHGTLFPIAMMLVVHKHFREPQFDEALRQLASELGKRGASKRQKRPGKGFRSDHAAVLRKCPITLSTKSKQVQGVLFTNSALTHGR